MNEAPVVSAALAGVPAGIQAQGVWAGRRQLFVRFAGEAETATMYTAAALVRELEKQQSRSAFHSICIGGRDPLANLNFLLAAFDLTQPRIPLRLDTDGQRPEALASLAPHLDLAQVTVEFVGSDANVTRAIETVVAAAAAKCAHALVLCPREDTSDGVVLRTIERAHGASDETQVVVHPPMQGGEQWILDRRWAALLDQAMSMHADTRLVVRIPPPTGLR